MPKRIVLRFDETRYIIQRPGSRPVIQSDFLKALRALTAEFRVNLLRLWAKKSKGTILITLDYKPLAKEKAL